MKRLLALLPGMLVLALSFALSTASFADISNIASATYQDAGGNVLPTVTSNLGVPVNVVTPPIVTAPANMTLDVNVAMTPVQVVATNNPTGFTLTSAPAGLTGISINNAGLISGAPGGASAGTYTATLSANNIAGPSANMTFTIVVRGVANIVLTKAADVAHQVSGQPVNYTIKYQNTAAGTANNVVITDVIPTGSTYVAGSANAGGVYTAGNTTLKWTIPSVPGNSAPVSLTFQVTVN